MRLRFLFLLLTFNCLALPAQQIDQLFYHYKDTVLSLPLNTQHFFVYVDTNEISLERLQRLYEVTEVVNSVVPNVVGLQVLCSQKK